MQKYYLLLSLYFINDIFQYYIPLWNNTENGDNICIYCRKSMEYKVGSNAMLLYLPFCYRLMEEATPKNEEFEKLKFKYEWIEQQTKMLE